MIFGMTKSKWRTRTLSLILPTVMLVSCGGFAQTTGNGTPAIYETAVNNTALAAASTLFVQTIAPTSTLSVIPTDTALPPAATSTSLPFKALDGLRVAYTSNGNLYVQDSGGQPVLLTSNVANRRPIFSGDGQKIVFYSATNGLGIINVDGTEERILITQALLRIFGGQYNESTSLAAVAFIPDTYDLIFNTGFSSETGESPSHLNKDLLLVHTATGEIRQLREPGQGGNFLASPDGKKIAVQTIDHVDVIDMQGKLLLDNLVARPPIDDYYGISWAEIAWTPDSNELIILPSKTDPAAGIPIIRTVWRFPLAGGNQGIEIKLDPAPSYNAFSVSPDGNWIAYTYTATADALVSWLPELVTWDTEKPLGVHLGNLYDGTSQLIYHPSSNDVSDLDLPSTYYGWSPDSVSFIVADYWTQLFIGNTHQEFSSIGVGRGIEISGWIDPNHFLTEDGVLHDVGNQELAQVVDYFDAFVFPEH